MTDNIISFETRSNRSGRGPRKELSEEEKLALRREAENEQNHIATKIRSRLSSSERLPEDDATKLAENFGYLIETSFPDSSKQAIREIARLAESNPDHVESRLKNRKRYIRLSNENHGSQIGKDGRVVLNWFFGLCEMKGHKVGDNQKETMALWPVGARDALMALANGTTLAPNQGPRLRAPSDRQKAFYDLMDRFASKLVEETDIIQYFNNLSSEATINISNWTRFQGRYAISKEPRRIEKFIHRSEPTDNDLQLYARNFSFSFSDDTNDGLPSEMPSVRTGLLFFPIQVLCVDQPVSIDQITIAYEQGDIVKFKREILKTAGIEAENMESWQHLVDPNTLETVDGITWRTIWHYKQVEIFLAAPDIPDQLAWGIYLGENGTFAETILPKELKNEAQEVRTPKAPDCSLNLLDFSLDLAEDVDDLVWELPWYKIDDDHLYLTRPFNLRGTDWPIEDDIVGAEPSWWDLAWNDHIPQEMTSAAVWDQILSPIYEDIDTTPGVFSHNWERPSRHYRNDIKPIFMPFIDRTDEWTPVGHNTVASAIISSLTHSDSAEGFEAQMRSAINERVRLFGEMMDRLNSKFQNAQAKKDL